MCHELGRFPFELPENLPDEQVLLMNAYLRVRDERRQQSSPASTMRSAAERDEAQLKAAEAEAWEMKGRRDG